MVVELPILKRTGSGETVRIGPGSVRLFIAFPHLGQGCRFVLPIFEDGRDGKTHLIGRKCRCGKEMSVI